MRKDKTLFELGDWQVRYQPFFSFNSNAINVLHINCESETNVLARHVASWYSNDPPICSRCGIPVPDEIQGILVMLISGSPIHAW